MSRLALAKGARPETMQGLAGVGDLVKTTFLPVWELSACSLLRLLWCCCVRVCVGVVVCLQGADVHVHSKP